MGDFNGYGYFYVRLYWSGFGLPANIVEEYVLLSALLHATVAILRTRTIWKNKNRYDGKVNSGRDLAKYSGHLIKSFWRSFCDGSLSLILTGSFGTFHDYTSVPVQIWRYAGLLHKGATLHDQLAWHF